jgi:hypothetical protein
MMITALTAAAAALAIVLAAAPLQATADDLFHVLASTGETAAARYAVGAASPVLVLEPGDRVIARIGPLIREYVGPGEFHADGALESGPPLFAAPSSDPRDEDRHRRDDLHRRGRDAVLDHRVFQPLLDSGRAGVVGGTIVLPSEEPAPRPHR